MPFQNYKNANNAQGTLQAGISASAGLLIMQSGQGALFPSTFPFFLKIEQLDTALNNYRVLKREIVKVTNRVADTFTITRSSGICPPDYTSTTTGTTAFSFNAGDIVTHTITAEQFKDTQDEVTNLGVNKLNTSGGLRTGMTPKSVMTTNASGTETVLTGTNGQVVGFDATGTPVATTPGVDINGQTAVTTPASSDTFVEYSVSAGANRKILFSDLKGAISKKGGDGSDGALSGGADIILAGSNNTLIVKNYSSISAGSIGSQTYLNDPTAGANIVLNMSNTSLFAIGDYVRVSSSAGSEIAQVTAVATNVSITVSNLGLEHTTSSPLVMRMTKMTVTATNCIVYIKVKGNADLTNWVFDFIGKGGPGGGSGGGGTQGSTNFAFPGSGGGGGGYNAFPGAPTLQAFRQPPFALLADYFTGCGSGGGGGSSNQNGNPLGATGGSGGGCLILEVAGNINLGVAVTNAGNKQNFMFMGASGGNNSVGSGAGGGGGGGSLFIAYVGTLTGTSTYSFIGGIGGTAGGGGPYPGSSAAGGCSMVSAGTGCVGYNFVSGGSSGNAGNGGAGFSTFQQINLIA